MTAKKLPISPPITKIQSIYVALKLNYIHIVAIMILYIHMSIIINSIIGQLVCNIKLVE